MVAVGVGVAVGVAVGVVVAVGVAVGVALTMLQTRFQKRIKKTPQGVFTAALSEVAWRRSDGSYRTTLVPYLPSPFRSPAARKVTGSSESCWHKPMVQPSAVSRRFNVAKGQNRFSGHRRVSSRTSRMLTDADSQAGLYNLDLPYGCP